jgi:hypothetical protein
MFYFELLHPDILMAARAAGGDRAQLLSTAKRLMTELLRIVFAGH